jgi:hypothetical protein
MALPKLNTPKYELAIPSTGKEVKFRPYLVKEEKILMIALESEDEKSIMQAVKDIIESCTFGEVNSNRLTMFDMEYVFTKIRTKSVGETTTLKLPCEKCEHINEVVVDLDNDLKVSEGKDKKIQLTSDTGVIMKYPTVNDYVDASSAKGSEIDKIFKLMAAAVESIYSGDEMFDAASEPEKEIIEFLESLNSAQFTQVKEFFDNMPQASINVSYTCSECGNDHSMDLKGMQNFFA